MLLRSALSITSIIFSLSVAQSDELPKELLLKCSGEESAFMSIGGKPELHQRKFSETLHLKNNSIGNIKYNFLDGKNCELNNGIIVCGLNSTKFISTVNATELRRTNVEIVRATGEYRYRLRTWSARGKSKPIEGKPGLELIRSGVCQPISGPIF
jgi:hypothetical protein